MRTGDELLVEFLGERDAACPGCGYNLRGVSAGRCPECARGLALMLERPAMRPPVRLCVCVIALQMITYAYTVAFWVWISATGQMGFSGWRFVRHGILFVVFAGVLAWHAARRRDAPSRERFVRLTLWLVIAAWLNSGVEVLIWFL